MNTDNKLLNWPLRIVSYLYLVFMPISILGIIIIPTGANYFFAFGPKSYLYMLLYGLFGAYLEAIDAKIVWICIGVAAVLFAVILGLGVYAHIKKRYFVLFTVAVADVAVACLLCLVLELHMMWFILFNVLYCAWLGIALLKARRHIHDEGEQKLNRIEGDME